MATDIERQLKEMLVDRCFLKISADDIEDDKRLIDHYDVDSVSLLEMVVGMEEQFGISVEDEEFTTENFRTIDCMATFVRSKLD